MADDIWQGYENAKDQPTTVRKKRRTRRKLETRSPGEIHSESKEYLVDPPFDFLGFARGLHLTGEMSEEALDHIESREFEVLEDLDEFMEMGMSPMNVHVLTALRLLRDNEFASLRALCIAVEEELLHGEAEERSQPLTGIGTYRIFVRGGFHVPNERGTKRKRLQRVEARLQEHLESLLAFFRAQRRINPT